MTGKNVDHRVLRTGRRGLGEIRGIVSRATGVAAERVDTRLPLRTGLVYRGEIAVGVVGLHRYSGKLRIRAFHFLPEARGDLAIGFRESLRIGASEESREVEVALANPDPWAEDFLAPLVPPKPVSPEEEGPPPDEGDVGADRPKEREFFPAASRIAGISVTAGIVAGLAAWLLPMPVGREYGWITPLWFGWGVFATLYWLPALVASLLDPSRARRLGPRVLPLRRPRVFSRGMTGVAGAALVFAGWLIVPMSLSLPAAIRGTWLGLVLLGALCVLLRHRLRRPGAREGGLSLPEPAVAVPWDEIGSWRRDGDGFRIGLLRWHPGLERRNVSLDLHRGTADALEKILRREAPRPEET